MKYNKQVFCDMTNEKKLDLIKQELDLETHNATTKDDLLMMVDWLYWRAMKGDLKPNKVIRGKSEEKVKGDIWSWNEKNNEDWFNGTFSTREEAVEEALRMAKEYGFDEFYVGKCEVVPLETSVDAENLLYDLDERYCDESGCDYYIYDGVEEEHIKWLEDKMQEVIEEFHKRANIKSNWFNVVSTELVKVDEISN